jgi:hypothetical protein
MTEPTRGCQYFAVMGMKEGWKKPRFVWSAGLRRQLYIYARRRDANRRCKEMKADGQLEFCPENEYAKNAPKTVPVEWIVCAVWVETMPGGGK